MRERLVYLDAMRGFCMMMVVYCHLQVDGLVGYDFTNSFLGIAREALFMFISGFLSYSAVKAPISKVKNRFWNLFLPTLVTGGIFIFFMNHMSVMTALRHNTKSGYWFTWVLFEIFVFFAVTTWLTDKISNRFRQWLYVLMVLICPILLWLSNHRYSTFVETDWYQIMSMRMILGMMPFFFLGVLAKMYKEHFMQLIVNPLVTSIFTIGFLLGCYYRDYLGYMSGLYILGVLGVLFYFAFFYQFKSLFSIDKWVGRWMAYVGTRSIHIYFLHYFVLFGVQQGGLLPLLRTYTDALIGIPIYILVTLLITTVCLGIEVVLRRMAPLIHRLMFGSER